MSKRKYEQADIKMVLKTIYMIFIGVLLAIFVGVGIAAFYPEPEYPETPLLLKLYKPPTEPISDPTISAQLEEEQRAFDEALKTYREKSEEYNRNVSIISLIAAILVLTISLTLFRKILIIADGLLLGGVITLLYSVVRVFGSGDDKLRFVVVSVGLVVSLILGYLKFIAPSKNK